MILCLPLISHFSALTQSGILALLIILSYLHKGARYIITGLVISLIGFKVLVPTVRWLYILFKWIAMLGFYVQYFQVGVGFISTGIAAAIAFVEGGLRELEKSRQEERERKQEEERERQRARERNTNKPHRHRRK